MARSASRRQVLTTLAASTALAAVGRLAEADGAASADGPAIQNNRINQTICRWCYAKIPLDDLCAAAVRLGYRGIDLVGPDDFATLKKHKLVGTMVGSHPIDPGLAHKENHEMCIERIHKAIEATADAGFPNVICFSGNRKGMDELEGMNNCAIALKQVVGFAEEKKVTLCMELLNSKVNHPDYMCDHTQWGVDLCKKVGSERFKLLYDIYHMQIMEGDVIATINRHKEYLAHFHTGGVPGRHEIDDTQELNYPAIMKAIVATGYKGWVGQEFIPEHDPVASLAQAGKTCDV